MKRFVDIHYYYFKSRVLKISEYQAETVLSNMDWKIGNKGKGSTKIWLTDPLKPQMTS